MSQRFSRTQFHEHDALAHQWNSSVRPNSLATNCATATSNPCGEPSFAWPVRGIEFGTAQITNGVFLSFDAEPSAVESADSAIVKTQNTIATAARNSDDRLRSWAGACFA
jgi:hypothetical protein